MNRTIFNLLFITLLTTCGQKQISNVQYYGSLKSIMHEADISAKVSLNELQTTRHLYALGAAENLKGEIIIIDSKPYTALVENNILNIDTTFNKNASLLVFSSVTEWKDLSIIKGINNLKEFESFVVKSAANSGIDTSSAFPFLIKGKVASANWHVIDWVEGDTVHTHEKHKNSGLHGTIENEEVTILGFYSIKHKGIFTHKSSNIHMHVLSKNKLIAGHLDNFTLGKNILLLPDIN